MSLLSLLSLFVVLETRLFDYRMNPPKALLRNEYYRSELDSGSKSGQSAKSNTRLKGEAIVKYSFFPFMEGF